MKTNANLVTELAISNHPLSLKTDHALKSRCGMINEHLSVGNEFPNSQMICLCISLVIAH